MKAGRELDALVAEKVMGWEAVNDELEIAKREGNPDLVDSQRWHRRKVWFKGNEKMACEECGTLPAYSTDIADAWGVVPVLDQRLDQFWSVVRAGEKFEFYSNPYELGDYTAYVEADTLPLLLCLAALKAKGVTGEQHG